MKDIDNIIKNLDKRMIAFIMSFISGDIAVVIAISMIVWVLFERLGAEYFSIITLVSLLVNTILIKKYSYLLDRYSRIGAVVLSNKIMMILMIATVVTDWIWLYAILSFAVQLYFSVFYTARSALAQAMIESQQNGRKNKRKPMSFKQLNSVLVITDKFGAILSGLVVAGLFTVLSVSGLMALGIVILGISTILFMRFDEPKIQKTKQESAIKIDNQNTHSVTISEAHRGFRWYFSHPISWLVTLAIFIHVVIMLNNTIQPIYLYEVLTITPEMMAYTSVAFNIGALSGGVLVNFSHILWFTV